MPDLFSYIARWYDRIFRFLDPGPLLRLLEPQPGQWLLDLGGGTGRVAQALDHGRVIVCDPSAGMAWQARQKGFATCRGYAECLPFSEDRFDRLLVVDAFHHFRDHREAVREMLRVLRPGGRLVLEEPDIRRPAVRAIALVERVLAMRSHFFTLGELIAFFEDAGGEVVATDVGANSSVRLVATKEQP